MKSFWLNSTHFLKGGKQIGCANLLGKKRKKRFIIISKSRNPAFMPMSVRGRPRGCSDSDRSRGRSLYVPKQTAVIQVFKFA